MKFLIKESPIEKNFSLIYCEEEYSFDTERHNDNGCTSIMINDLQLEIDEDGKVLYVWGLCPLIKYKDINAIPVNYHSNALIALLDKSPVPGISYKLNALERWPIYINKQIGWICIGDPILDGKQLVEFAPKCIAALANQEITAIWLQPKQLPSLD